MGRKELGKQVQKMLKARMPHLSVRSRSDWAYLDVSCQDHGADFAEAQRVQFRALGINFGANYALIESGHYAQLIRRMSEEA